MTMLAALERAYRWMPDAPRSGFAMAKIGVVVGLNEDGTIATISSLKEKVGKKEVARSLAVPAAVKRTAGIKPNSFWDKTSYVLGVTAGAGKRTAEEHAAFIEHHRDLIGDSDDPGLRALLRFLEGWSPERFEEAGFSEDMKDENVIFALEGERRKGVYIHDRPAAQALLKSEVEGEGALCLVTGERGPIARLHPSIKGVWGGQTAGGAIVSFNLDAFESYGHAQGDNAPVSEAAAEAYVGALNRFLANGSGHRMQIGDASVAFWAEAPAEFEGEEKRQVEGRAEKAFATMLSDEDKRDQAEEDDAEAREVRDALAKVRDAFRSQNAGSLGADVHPATRFYVLGLSPNAARISVRFWLDTSFGALAESYRRFVSDMAVEPLDRRGPGNLYWHLRETAVLGKSDNIAPSLAGEWARAILSGTPYPLTLLNTVLMRIRADGEVNGRRASILKAVLIRNFGFTEGEAPVGLDRDNRRRGYLLGRLFAVYEQAQSAALGRNVNATIKDKFYGSASAQPRKVFPILDSGSANHLSKLGKVRPGQRTNLEKEIAEIMEKMEPGETPADDPFPATLPAAEQALFGLGYYHQRSVFFARKETADQEPDAA
ncbi:type I-C CRISPR-associated protein Cas8c/Csd1 [Fulvimarina endophytica]|uniref:Type I-C CRISPR-associated protein Cas8c/Csd1 n=1 Tax=Fulvimarina endophytica TaxID=2293836 RepID=A0A371WZ67_9HYPH|nr:type I-C CRISPR-associated protein Cas8c/Csd1 [Fulvimarina endophytica]RFC62249.1 type I-C CRISPR-associated protein Cas8c/Csd1 [Fulvimarina endophytica]